MNLYGYATILGPLDQELATSSQIAVRLIALCCSWIGAEVSRRLFILRKVSVSLPFNFGSWLALSFCWLLMAILLTDFQSTFLASVLQFLTTTAFCVAVNCVVVNGRKQSLLWVVFAVVIFAYVAVHCRFAWPYTFYLGPSLWLHTFYFGNDAAFVTGHTMFNWYLALNAGMLADSLHCKLFASNLQSHRRLEDVVNNSYSKSN